MKFKIIISLLVVAILGAGIWTGYKVFNPSNKDTSVLKAQFLKGGDFDLSQGESEFKLSNLKGQVVVLYFGYTYCPDVCPTGLSLISESFKKLDLVDKDIKGVFVSLDPERDDERRLKEYSSFFHKDIIGITGTELQLATLAKNYGVFFRKVEMPDSELGYTLDHSANFFIIDKRGDLAYVLDHAVDSQVIADYINKLR